MNRENIQKVIDWCNEDLEQKHDLSSWINCYFTAYFRDNLDESPDVSDDDELAMEYFGLSNKREWLNLHLQGPHYPTEKRKDLAKLLTLLLTYKREPRNLRRFFKKVENSY